MHAHLLAMAMGLLASAWLPNWVGTNLLAMAACACLCIGAVLAWHRRVQPDALAKGGLCLVAFAAGNLFGLHAVDEALERRLPIALHGTEVSAEVEVVSEAVTDGLATRFDAKVRDLARPDGLAPHLPKRLRITWFDAPRAPLEGEVWMLELKLRSPIGTLNERSFDYEAWLLAGGVDALGSVKSGVLLKRSSGSWVASARQGMREFVTATELNQRGPLLALATGDSTLMQRADWRLFRDTGTVHLMVISGLHLGLVAFYAGLLGMGVARLVPALSTRIPAQVSGVMVGVGCAFAFALLCGWTLPVSRAFIMVCCAGVALIWRRPFGVANAWLVALIVVLGMNPFASLASGFWLSFGAVGLLLLMGWNSLREAGWKSWARQLVRTQALLSIGMAPLLLLTVSEWPLVSLVANLLAVPVTTLMIVPLVLITHLLLPFSSELAAISLLMADIVFSLQMRVLDYLAASPRALAVTMNPLIGGVCLASLLCLFLPANWPMRVLLLFPGLLLALVLMPSSPRLHHGEFGLRMFDVGQGLSVLVETRHKSLLFDVGASFSGDFSFADAVVRPEVRLAGWQGLDRLLLSHWDNDHAGGAAEVIEALEVPVLMVTADGTMRPPLVDAALTKTRLTPCQAGEAWTWDGVRFRVLHPQRVAGRPLSSNDRSCVLLIENDDHAALLPADISQAVEFEIMADVPKLQLLVAAHHGSRSSSSMSFLRRSRPEFVWVSSGFDNRFGHPHADRVDAWRSVGAEAFDTARMGALRWRSSEPAHIVAARHLRPAFWRLKRQDA